MGIPLNDSILYSLRFVDHLVVLCQDYEDLDYMTHQLLEEYQKGELEVHIKKTEYMCIDGEQQI